VEEPGEAGSFDGNGRLFLLEKAPSLLKKKGKCINSWKKRANSK
jgi:hypothetical protein